MTSFTEQTQNASFYIFSKSAPDNLCQTLQQSQKEIIVRSYVFFEHTHQKFN